MIDENKLKQEIASILSVTEDTVLAGMIMECIENQPQADKWIPFEQREADDEEKEYWLENYGIEIEYMLCGNLPNDDEEILVSCNGHVMTDTFMRDCGECYLDSGCEIIEEATAWMPLPAPYKKEGAENG